MSEGLTEQFLNNALSRYDADIADVEDLLTRLRRARAILAGDPVEVPTTTPRRPPEVRPRTPTDAPTSWYRGGAQEKYRPLVVNHLRENANEKLLAREVSEAVSDTSDYPTGSRGAEATVRRVLKDLAAEGRVDVFGSRGSLRWRWRREAEPPAPEATTEAAPAPPQEEPQEEVQEEEPPAPPPPEPPPPAPKPPPAPRAEEGGRDFLAAGHDGRAAPEGLRRLTDIRQAIREMEGEITSERLIREWNVAHNQATRVIQQMLKEGVIRPARPPKHKEQIAYTSGPSTYFDTLPQASVPWQEMPSWKNATNRDIANELAAKQQSAILSVAERSPSVVASEVFEELQQFGFNQVYVAQQLRVLDTSGLIRRVGMRRGRNQDAGRPAIEYAVPNARPRLVEPEPPKAEVRAADRPSDEQVMAWVASAEPFTGRDFANAFGESIGWAGLTIGKLSGKGLITRQPSGRWAVTEAPQPEAQPDPQEEPQDAAAPEVPPEALAKVRDWVTAQKTGDVFSPGQVASATELDRVSVLAALLMLTERGVASDESPSPDMRLFGYAGKPKEPGKAAELDIARRAAERAVPPSVIAPVEGTGKGMRIPDKDANALVQKAIRLGAKVTRLGDGHFSVTRPGRPGTVTVAGTPSKPALDRLRKRMRTELGLAV